jgi:hypothetical protein
MANQAPNRAHQKSTLQELHQHVHKNKLFEGQRDQENIQMMIRRHWVAEVRIFLRFLVLGVVIPGVIVLILSYISHFSAHFWNILYAGVIFYLLFIWLHTFIEFLKNELSVLVVTSERLVDMIQASLFVRQVSEANLNRIQDVIGFTSGITGTFLDVGKLEIQTASRDVSLTIDWIKYPHLTARKILDVQRESLQRRRVSDETKSSLRKRADDTMSDAEIVILRNNHAVTPKRRPEIDQL